MIDILKYNEQRGEYIFLKDGKVYKKILLEKCDHPMKEYFILVYAKSKGLAGLQFIGLEKIDDDFYLVTKFEQSINLEKLLKYLRIEYPQMSQKLESVIDNKIKQLEQKYNEIGITKNRYKKDFLIKIGENFNQSIFLDFLSNSSIEQLEFFFEQNLIPIDRERAKIDYEKLDEDGKKLYDSFLKINFSS